MLKNKKAFTLVELLAVIIILGIILVLAVPRVTTMINKYRDNAEARQKDLISSAAEKYMVFEEITFEPLQTEIIITLNQLVSKGYLKDGLKNPKTSNPLHPTNTLVTVTKTGTGLTFVTTLADET